MRILVTGGSGTLGTALALALVNSEHEVRYTDHRHGSIASLGFMSDMLATVRPDVVINAAGVARSGTIPRTDIIEANSTGPHILATACRMHGARLIHVSCAEVYMGHPGTGYLSYYPDLDLPNPETVIGQSKALGEVFDHSAIVVRTDFFDPKGELWRAMAAEPGATVEVSAHAWSGSTVGAVARSLVGIAENHARIPSGIFHLATDEAAAWCDSAVQLSDALSLGAHVVPTIVDARHLVLGHSDILCAPLEPFAEAIKRDAGAGA